MFSNLSPKFTFPEDTKLSKGFGFIKCLEDMVVTATKSVKSLEYISQLIKMVKIK